MPIQLVRSLVPSEPAVHDGKLPAVPSNIMTTRPDTIVSAGRSHQKWMPDMLSQWSAPIDQLEAQRARSIQQQEQSLSEMRYTVEVCAHEGRQHKSVSELGDPSHEGATYTLGTQTSESLKQQALRTKTNLSGPNVRPGSFPSLVRQEIQPHEPSVSTISSVYGSRMLGIELALPQIHKVTSKLECHHREPAAPQDGVSLSSASVLSVVPDDGTPYVQLSIVDE